MQKGDMEVVMLSAKVVKINKFSMRQEREILCSNINFYHLKKKKVRRVLPLT